MICGLKPVGGSLQRRDVIDGQKCVIVLAEGDLGSLELLFDEGVAAPGNSLARKGMVNGARARELAGRAVATGNRFAAGKRSR